MLKDVVWHKCCEQLPVNDEHCSDIFIVLRKLPYAVFTGFYDPNIPELPFYIFGVGRVQTSKVLYWAEVPDGFIPDSDVKE